MMLYRVFLWYKPDTFVVAFERNYRIEIGDIIKYKDREYVVKACNTTVNLETGKDITTLYVY
jgi:hypothetical protein